jgi:hypothetical protein
MATEQKPKTLEDEVRRLRAGVVKPVSPTRDPRQSEMVRVVSAASLAWEGQLERVDRFSLPLLPSGTTAGERANATTTSQLFLEQLASDYRRVAPPTLDLREVEAQRKSEEGAAVLEIEGVLSRPVAPLAVGQYLASHERAANSDLASVLEPWIFADYAVDHLRESQYATAFGDVLGPLVEVALDKSHDHASRVLPDWSSHVGDKWCEEFLAAGAQILKYPAVLSPSQVEGEIFVTSRHGSVDVTETVNNVAAFAEVFRPVEEARVSGTAIWPKIDLVLSGDALRPEEFAQFMSSVQNIPADVMILPKAPDARSSFIRRLWPRANGN